MEIVDWRKASLSSANGELCVEVAVVDNREAVNAP